MMRLSGQAARAAGRRWLASQSAAVETASPAPPEAPPPPQPSPRAQAALAKREAREARRRAKAEARERFLGGTEFREAFPDFLPQPHWPWRSPLVESLERRDMLRRRCRLDVPEFYVGSIVAVTCSDKFVPGQQNRFLGIVVRRELTGLRHSFTLRNVIDEMGVEIMYHLYNPLVQKIEVIRLERRLDDDLGYLRDAELHHSHFPQDLHPTPHAPGTPVPLNTSKVRLRSPPWHTQWQTREVHGIDHAHMWDMITPYFKTKYPRNKSDVQREELRFDMGQFYRETLPREDEEDVLDAVAEETAALGSLRPDRPLLPHRNLPNKPS